MEEYEKDMGGTAGYELEARRPDTPEQADFALSITDAGMEPYIKSGERVYVQARSELEEFEPGIFMYGGRILCRQWCEDYNGTVHLLCANPLMRRENISISRQQRDGLVCLGRVLLTEKLPPPRYD